MKINEKEKGSYYTPEIIAKFIVNHISPKLTPKKEIKILEPSLGNGIFLKFLCNLPPKKIYINGVDVNTHEIKIIQDTFAKLNNNKISGSFFNEYFLDFQDKKE
jgi:adenine-specific DNA-methyltransferase